MSRKVLNFIDKIKLIVVVGVVGLFFLINNLVIYASSNVAKINDTYYDDCHEAWSAVNDGDTITMLNDWTLEKLLTVAENITVTIDMNGYMINRNLSSEKDSGEIFLVKPNATLNLRNNDFTRVHNGLIKNDVWKYNSSGNYPLYGALLTGAYNANGGGAVHIQKNATVNIDGVTIAGNISSCSSGAGAIRLQAEDGILNLKNSKILYNKATGGGGGAIRIEGVDSTVNIENSRISYNRTTKSNSDGGAIQINEGIVNLINSEISFNHSEKRGGGIYINNGNLVMDEDSVIFRNDSKWEGGAIYVNSDADRVHIKGTISGNTSLSNGGGVYIGNSINGVKGTVISNAEIINNTATKKGSGVYVDYDNDFSLEGKVVITGNTTSNLYIQANDTITTNNLSSGSNIGLSCSWGLTTNKKVNTSNYEYFKSDYMDYKITGDGTYLTFTKTDITTPSHYSYNGVDYDLIKGQFSYKGRVESDNLAAYYYYSDGYFAQSAKYYNEHLATMAINMSMAAMTSGYSGEYTVDKGAKNIINLFTDLGFEDLYVHYPEPEFYGIDEPIISTIGFIIGNKTITIAGEEQTLLAVAVRGGGYGAEWASNVILGDGYGEAKGFGDAADQVEGYINKYINDYNIDTTKSKYLITGFSRAAATSNLVGKRLTDAYGEDNVYTYCFETPMGGVFQEMEKGCAYANIHNIINKVDVVTMVGTKEMGFIRYGSDHIVPAHKVGSDGYNNQKSIMLNQLAAINNKVSFDDYFHEATIEYVGDYLGFSDLISENWFEDYSYAEDWLPFFIEKLQEYALTNEVLNSPYNKDSNNWLGYRNFWADCEWYLYSDSEGLKYKSLGEKPVDYDTVNYYSSTLEGAIADLMYFYFGSSSEKKEQILNVINPSELLDRLNLSGIYKKLIRKWNGYNFTEKNEQIISLWNDLDIEKDLAGILTADEIFTVKKALYVVLDFALEFVSEDYDKNSQDILGTLVYNISNILQTHYHDVACAWVRSYDSYYMNDYVAAPKAPNVNIESGTYRDSLTIELYSENKNYEIYYTLDGTNPVVGSENCYKYDGSIKLEMNENSVKKYIINAICVKDDLVSEVSTFTYTLNSNAIISVNNDLLRVYNFDDFAYLIIASYNDNGLLVSMNKFHVFNNDYISLNELNLDYNNNISAFLVNNLTDLTPLSDYYSISGDKEESVYLNLISENQITITDLNAVQDDNPEFIDVSFSLESDNVDIITIMLYENETSLKNIIYINQIYVNSTNYYEFKISRKSLAEALVSTSVDGSSLILAVGGNSVTNSHSKEIIYEEEVYNIIYHLDGGINDPNNPNVFTMSSSEIYLNSPIKEHYTFDGWYEDPSFTGSKVTEIETGTNGDVELYAKWVINQYTVRYTDGLYNVTIFEDKVETVDYNTNTPLFGTDPIREGYNFLGWDKEIAEKVTGNVVYTAVWAKEHVHNGVLVEGVEATCCTPGYKSYYVCEDCGYFEDAECTISILDIEEWKLTTGLLTKEHNFIEKIEDYSHLVIGTGRNCQDAVEYYYDCETCDLIGSISWVSDNYGEHNIDPNFTSVNNQHYHVCLNEGCEYTTKKIDCFGGNPTCTEKAICDTCKEEYGELKTHVFDQMNKDETYLKESATCQHGSIYYYSCSCGLKGTTTFEENDVQEHKYINYVSNNDATYLSDGTKTATCEYGCGNKDTVVDEGSKIPHDHTGGNATCTEKAVCSICGSEYGELKTHVFDQMNKDEAHLKESATCQHGSIYYYSCSCGLKGTTIFEENDVQEHKYINYVSNNDATYLSDGTKTATCEYGCGNKDTVVDEGSKIPHDHTGGNATCTEKAVCSICGSEYGELKDHECNNEWSSDDENHWCECDNCDAIINNEKHIDENNDYICDKCNHKLTKPAKSNNVGTIIAVVSTSVLGLSIGGFSLVWFVIKKKKFSDLLKIFTKK